MKGTVERLGPIMQQRFSRVAGMIDRGWWHEPWYPELDSIRQAYATADSDKRLEIVEAAQRALGGSELSRLALLSFLYVLTREPSHAQALLSLATCMILSPVEADFLYWSLIRIEFTDPHCWDQSGHLAMRSSVQP